MGNRIKIRLTGIGEVLSEAAEKKLEQETDETPVCDLGRSREWYNDMGLPESKIPQELKDREKVFNKGVELVDEDYEEVFSDILVFYDEVRLIVEGDEVTTVFLKDGLTITVLETVDEIESYVEYMEMSWFRRKYLLFLTFFRQKTFNKTLTE